MVIRHHAPNGDAEVSTEWLLESVEEYRSSRIRPSVILRNSAQMLTKTNWESATVVTSR